MHAGIQVTVLKTTKN